MKRSCWQRAQIKLAALGAAGCLFVGLPGDLGCTSFFANAGLGSLDLCFLLNCNDGALGGLLDFCAPINFTSFVGQGGNGEAAGFLADCPQQ